MIRNVKWDHHMILGDLELDFVNTSTGRPYDTIVLAGENGVGKTTILETLATFLNLRTFEPFEHITYEANGGVYTNIKGNMTDINFGFHERRDEASGSTERIRTAKNNAEDRIAQDLKDIRRYGCAYSKARSGFSTKPVKTAQTTLLDSNRYEMDESDDFTRIKQMLIDIRQQDSEEWATISDSGSAITREQFNATSRMYRFRNAFDRFFDTIRFSRIEKRVLFAKNGHEIPVDGLSTGEKQIVFRGAHLLKNLNGLNGGIVLIDEPELSMHPKWQDRVLKYYRELFSSGGAQCVQMIFATHSEYVLRAALEDPEHTLVIVLSESGGTITPRKIDRPSAVLPQVTAAETNFMAFDIYSIDYHIELFSYLQSKIGDDRIVACDQYIQAHPKYNAAVHARTSVNPNTGRSYNTLPTFVRNRIDHPDPTDPFTKEQLRVSTDLLIELCR